MLASADLLPSSIRVPAGFVVALTSVESLGEVLVRSGSSSVSSLRVVTLRPPSVQKNRVRFLRAAGSSDQGVQLNVAPARVTMASARC